MFVLVIFIYCASERKEAYFLEQGWARPVEMTESERDT